MERFLSKIVKTESCWNWNASLRGKSGYGAFKLNGKTVDAHRVSYQLHIGEIPENMCVCHKCDNRKCVNPEHLFLGTHSDNMKDAFNKKRLIVPTSGRFKEDNLPKSSLLTDRKEIRELKLLLLNRTKSLKKLSEELNLPYQFLRDINSGRTYKKF